MRVLYFYQGKIEIYPDLIVKYKQVKNEIIVSYFALVADDYFYTNLINMSDEKFNNKYHAHFGKLYNNYLAAKEEIPYDIAPIAYRMRTRNGEEKTLLVLDEKSRNQFEKNIRDGFSDIQANIVKRVFIVGEYL